MPRAVAKVLEGLAGIFFSTLRAIAALTGASLNASVIGVTAAILAINVPLVFIARRGSVGPLPAVLFNSTVLLMFLGVIRVGKATKIAIEARDLPEATRLRTIIEGKGDPKAPAMRAMKRLGDGELLLQFEKWEAAADTLGSVDLEYLPEIVRPGIVSELGYAHAHAGDTARGLADLDRAFALADAQGSYPAGKRFHLTRRRGIALSLAGEHARAAALLTAACDDFQGDAREWSEAFYFLGRSHGSLDDPDAAGRAFVSAVVGEGPFVGRAWKELEKLLDPADLAALRDDIRGDQQKKN
jgi:hypothetical protein